MAYKTVKGFEKAGVNEKTKRQKFLTQAQLQSILYAVDESNERKKERDHAIIYLSYYLGLRVSECAILERDTFRYMDDRDLRIRTSKSLPRIKMLCPKCGRKWNASCLNIGKEAKCPRCPAIVTVVLPTNKKIDFNPPEKSPTTVETPVIDYVCDYMRDRMRPDQRWFFETKHNYHISTRMLRKIFSHYAALAGLPPQYSFHSLRHGRGVMVYSRFRDLVSVRDFLRQASISSAEIYARWSPDREQEMLDKLEEGM